MKNPIPAGFCAPTMHTAAIAIGIANLNAHALLIEFLLLVEDRGQLRQEVSSWAPRPRSAGRWPLAEKLSPHSRSNMDVGFRPAAAESGRRIAGQRQYD
jgi:hypothetical protein